MAFMMTSLVIEAQDLFVNTCLSSSRFIVNSLRVTILRWMVKPSVTIKYWSNTFVLSSTTNKMIGLTFCSFAEEFFYNNYVCPSIMYTALFANTRCHPHRMMLEHSQTSKNLVVKNCVLQLPKVCTALSRDLNKPHIRNLQIIIISTHHQKNLSFKLGIMCGSYKVTYKLTDLATS